MRYLHTLVFILALLATSSSYANTTEAPKGILPKVATPIHYDVSMLIDPRKDSFSASIDLTLNINKPTDHIWLHGLKLQVKKIYLNTNKGIIPTRYKEVLPSGVAQVSFNKTVSAGQYVLRIEYDANFDNQLSGLFKVTEKGHSYALAKSESIQARRYIPSFDEPGYKAPFTFHLTVPSHYEAITNTPVKETVAISDTMEVRHYATTPPMPTYLLSLAVGPFDKVIGPTIPASQYRDKPIPLQGFARKGRGAELDYILGITPRFIAIFEEQLHSAYPFQKLDIVAAPAWPSGATELSAAITYRESRILLGDNPAPAARRALLAIHAHEIAHMWFGNSVTPGWWDDLWLKEGFSSWLDPLVLNLFEPEAGHDIELITASLSAMRLDSLASTRAIREPIFNNANIRNAYDGITYRKSVGVINMMDQYFGETTFRPALGRFLALNEGGAVDSQDFYNDIAEITKEPKLVKAFKSVVEQPGVPLLDFQLDCTSTLPKLNITQQRFAPLGSSIKSNETLWSLPVCISINGQQHCDIIEQAKTTWQLTGQCPTQLTPNLGGNGYYRYTLTPYQWQQIANNFNSLSAGEQLSTIDSAIQSFESGKLPTTTFITLIEASAQSNTREVIEMPLSTLSRYLDRHINKSNQKAFQDWATQLYRPVLDQAKKETGENAALITQRLISFFANTLEDPATVQQLAQKTDAFLGYQRAEEPSALSTDYYRTAIRSWLQAPSKQKVAHLQQVIVNTDDANLRMSAVSELARVDAQWLQNEHYDYILNTNTESRDAYSTLMALFLQDNGFDTHFQWVVSNFEAITDRIPNQWRRRLPNLGSQICTPDNALKLQQLFDQQGQLAPGYKRALDQTLEKANLCMAQAELGKKLETAFTH